MLCIASVQRVAGSRVVARGDGLEAPLEGIAPITNATMGGAARPSTTPNLGVWACVLPVAGFSPPRLERFLIEDVGGASLVDIEASRGSGKEFFDLRDGLL